MQYEPPIDRARLCSTVRDAYGIELSGLRFVPLGYAAACYSARTGDGSCVFLKLWPRARPGSRAAARLEATLRLMSALYERALFRLLPVPFATRDGKLTARYADAIVAVFPFLPGSEPPAAFPYRLQAEWAHTLAQIHRATAAVGDVLPARETFNIPFERPLRRALARIESIGDGERAGLLALRRLVLPRRDEVEQQLARLHALRSVVRRLPGPFVVCHTDAGGQNLLVDGERMFVLDWDDAALAPPEHDLHEARFMDPTFVLEQYAAAGGAQPLWIDHFAFYLLRRHLGDMSVRILHLLEAERSADEDAHLLEGIEACGFAQWKALPQTLGAIGEALGQRTSYP